MTSALAPLLHAALAFQDTDPTSGDALCAAYDAAREASGPSGTIATLRYHGLISSTSLALTQRGTPDPILHEMNQRQTMKGMALHKLGLQITERFDQAALPHRFLKGPRLAMALHGNPGGRAQKDLDILVPPDRLVEADTILNHIGFYRLPPFDGLTPERFAVLTRGRGSEIFYVRDRLADGHRPLGMVQAIELHWRAQDTPGLWDPTAAARWYQQPAPVHRTATPALDPLWDGAYLCLHGAMHRWSRLKWLDDVIRLPWENADWADAVWDHARTMGCLGPVMEALLLRRDLGNRPLPTHWLDRNATQITQRTRRIRYQHGSGPDSTPTEILSEAALRPDHLPHTSSWIELRRENRLGGGTLLRLLLRRVFVPAPTDLADWPLAPGLLPLFGACKPLLWLARRIRAGRQSR